MLSIAIIDQQLVLTGSVNQLASGNAQSSLILDSIEFCISHNHSSPCYVILEVNFRIASKWGILALLEDKHQEVRRLGFCCLNAPEMKEFDTFHTFHTFACIFHQQFHFLAEDGSWIFEC